MTETTCTRQSCRNIVDDIEIPIVSAATGAVIYVTLCDYCRYNEQMKLALAYGQQVVLNKQIEPDDA